MVCMCGWGVVKITQCCVSDYHRVRQYCALTLQGGVINNLVCIYNYVQIKTGEFPSKC